MMWAVIYLENSYIDIKKIQKNLLTRVADMVWTIGVIVDWDVSFDGPKILDAIIKSEV